MCEPRKAVENAGNNKFMYTVCSVLPKLSQATALSQCQRASKVILPFIIFAVLDVSFRRYKL